MATVPFADEAVLADGWRPLTDAEAIRAPVLLAKASRIVRSEIPSVDARILAETLDQALVADVVCDMVRRVLAVPVDQQPASQVQQTAPGFSIGVTYSNPDGAMYMSKAERRRLGTGQRASTVDMFTPVV